MPDVPHPTVPAHEPARTRLAHLAHRRLATLAAVFVLVLAVAGSAAAAIIVARSPGAQVPSPRSGLLPNGRQLTPAGVRVRLGNFPTGAALTADGRYLWTVSSGFGSNDVRIVDTLRHRVCQTISVPGASGGIALDSRHRLAYVSGLPNSRWQPSKNGMPGAAGNDVLVYSWSASCGGAQLDRVIPVPPQPGSPSVQRFPVAAGTSAWPERLAVSPDGGQLLVPLNLADSAAIVDLNQSDRIRYVSMGSGSYPYATAILPNGKIGLVTTEATGRLTMIDLAQATTIASITVGAPLSHPAGVVVDRAGKRAYVALSASDDVAVVNLQTRRVERTIWVGREAGLGTMPVALALGPAGTRLFVAESGADEIAVIRLPNRSTPPAQTWQVVGRIPTAEQPMAVVTAATHRTLAARLLWVAARGADVGPNPSGPNPTVAGDPIFWAFNPTPPTVDVFNTGEVGYLPAMVAGDAGVMRLPTDAGVRSLTPAASRQLRPVGAQRAPAGTPLRAGGPIKHVFFIVRENRSYDQMLGDLRRGNGDPTLSVFDRQVTPNLHSLVTRFPLLDNVMADSDASIQGHYWTSAASVPDYVSRNWEQNYGGRGRPADFGTYAVTWPGNGFLFDQAERQHISYFNYGEGFDGGVASLPDRNRSATGLAELNRVSADSDLGPVLTTNGCYPSDLSIGTALDGKEIFDSGLPAGAPAGSHSHFDCFKQRFDQQVAAGDVPTFSYLSLTSDHTRGTLAGFPTPEAMVADSDQALGQIVQLISHSPIWRSSAIFVVEDDSQDGADHVDAHRIPALVISPYARRGAVIHTRYDLLSVVRSMELIMGMRPLSLNDALATPMYDVFASTPVNAAPVTDILAGIDLLQRNLSGAPGAHLSKQLSLGATDEAPQVQLDGILWRSVYGGRSTPPPPGPNADSGQ